jgi:hypothetical protein
MKRTYDPGASGLVVRHLLGDFELAAVPQIFRVRGLAA